MVKQPIGPYTFGEEYNQIQEKNRLTEITYNKKKNQFTQAQIDRTKELAELYPTAQSGLISSAVLKGLDNKQFEALLKLQYKAVPKSQPSFPNTIGNDVANTAMYNSTFGKVFNAIGEQFKVPEGFKFWNKSSYQEEPVYGTFKGLFRVLALIGGAGANSTVGKPVRAFVKTAEKYEEPFLQISEIQKQKAEDLSARALAGDPDVTMYDVAVARDEANKTKRTGQIAGLALTLANLTGKGAVSGLRKAVGQTFADNYKNAGPSTAGVALEKIREGQDPGAVWKSFGEGYFPQGRIVAEALEGQEAFKYRGQNITAGRYVAEVAGVEQNTLLYNALSGSIDFYKVLVTDPFLVAGKLSKGIKFANSVQGKIQKAYRAGEFEKIPVEVNKFLNSSKSEPFLQAFAETNDFKRVFDAVRDPELALDLVKANNIDDVKNLMQGFVVKNQGVGVPALIRSKNSFGYNKNLVDALSKARKGDKAPYSKFGEWTPEAGALYRDAADSVKVYNQWLVEFKIPKNIANQLSQAFAEQAVKGNRAGMNEILFLRTKAQLKATMEAEGFSKKTLKYIDEYFDELQGKASGNLDVKSYFAKLGKTEGGQLQPMEKVFKGQRSIPGPDGKPILQATPFDIGQHFNDTWSLGKPLDIRRALGTVEKYVNIDVGDTKLVNLAKNFVDDLPEVSRLKLPVESLLENVVPKVDMLVSFAPEVIRTIPDVLWPLQKIWTGAQLITRVAWPLRLFGEGQFRMGLDGLDNWIESPMSTWVWTNYYNDILGNDFRKGIRPSKRAYEEIVQGIVADRPTNVFGKLAQKEFVQNSWKKVQKGTIDKKQYVSSWQLNLKWPMESDLAQSVAKELLDGSDLTKTKQSFWNGKLRSIRDELNDTRFDNDGLRMNPYVKLEDANKYVDDYVEWIMDLSKGDEEILTLIANRELNYQGKVIQFDNFDRWTPANQAQIRKFLSDKYEIAGPDVLPTPDWIQNPQQGNVLKQLFNKGSEFLWYSLGELPDSELQRIPTFTQYYWQSVASQLPFADAKAVKYFDDLIKQSKVPKEVEQLYLAGKNAAVKKYGSLEEAAKKIPENMRLSIDEINDAAKGFSLEMHNRLLYNLNQKGYVAEAMRLVFPFLEPWKEILLNYPRLFTKNPTALRKIQLATDRGTNNGFFYTDPVSGEKFYVTAPTDLTEYVYGIEDRDLSGFEEDVQLRLSSPVQGANLFTQSPIPGLGPVMKYSYKILKRFMPESRWTQEIEDVIFPYGLGDPGIEGATVGQLPVYMQQAYNTGTKGSLDEMGWANDVDNASKIMTKAWMEGYLPYDPRNDEGRALFEKDVIDLASRINVFESMAKGIAPSSPRAEAAYKLKLDERLANQSDFLDKENLVEVLEAFMPADYEFGKYDDDYFTNTVITALFRQAMNSVEPGEEYVAYQFIASLIGGTPEDWDALYTAAYLVQGNTTTLGTALPSTEEEVEWFRANPEKAEKYEYTYALFAPNVYEYDKLDVNSFYNQVDEGQRVTLTLDEKIERAQETAFKIIFNYQFKPYREALTDGKISQKDAQAEAALIKSELLEVFPYGTSARDLPKREPVSRYVVFEELKEVANDDFMVEQSDAAKGLKLFLYGDEENYGFMYYVNKVRNKEGLKKVTASGKETLYPESSAIDYLGRQENTQAMRDYLFNWGKEVVEQYPDFAGIYRSKFLYIVEYQYTP